MREFKFPLALLVLLSACDSYRYYSGRFFHETKRWTKAAEALEQFVQSRPQDPRACEARLRLGQIYSSVFDRPAEARRHYEAAARGFPEDKACFERAVAGLLAAPDYFPTDPGRTWIYGDSDSGGRAMRLDWEAREDGILASLYAGNKRLSVTRTAYVKKDWTVSEKGKDAAVLLRYPFTKGNEWRARGHRYRVEADGLQVKVRAGTFEGCIKIRENNPSIRVAWKYDYYCPGVGRVKTTVGAPGVESPNTELLRYTR